MPTLPTPPPSPGLNQGAGCYSSFLVVKLKMALTKKGWVYPTGPTDTFIFLIRVFEKKKGGFRV